MDKKSQDPLPTSRVNEEAQAVSVTGRLPVIVKEIPSVSLQRSRQTGKQDLSLTTGEDAVVTGIRRTSDDSCGREAHYDREIVREKAMPNLSSSKCRRQTDGPQVPVLVGDEVAVTQLHEKWRGVDEQEDLMVLAGVVPVEEGLPTMGKGCSESSDSQELPLPTRENPLHTSLRGSEDCDGVARAPSKDDKTVSGKDELQSSPSGHDRKADEIESSPRAKHQAGIAYLDESGQQTPAVLEEAVPAGEELRVLGCRCSEPIAEEKLRLPEEEWENVIACLLENEFNCSVKQAHARLAQDEEERAKGWEEAAGRAGVELERRRRVTVYTDEKAMDDIKMEIPRQVKYVGTRPAIPPSLADIPCADLGVYGMLQYLNCLLRTTYTLDRPGLSSVLQSYVERGFDFGLAYGYLRLWWFEDFALVQLKMWFRAAADKARRDRAIDGKYIVDRDLPPRRVWDLYSNRVLPWWVLRCWYLNWDWYLNPSQKCIGQETAGAAVSGPR